MSETLTGVAALAMSGFMIAFLALLLFMALVQPIWCVVDCAVDNQRGAAGKVIWIILLIVLYGLANWFYGAFAAAGPALRRLTRLAWAFAIVLLLAFAAMYYSHPEFRRGIEKEWQHGRSLVVLTDVPAAGTQAQEGIHAC
jgi:hypothetical protein